VQDGGEPGIARVQVSLTGTTGAGVGVSATATTDANGFYLFSDLLAPGSYSVSFTAPVGYVFTARDHVTDDAVDSDADTAGDTVTVTLASGVINLTRDAGLYRPAAVGNLTWLDASEAGTSANSSGIFTGPGGDTNVNGIQDIDEEGIGGVMVTLTGWTGAGEYITLTAYTNATGFYQFTNLAPGTYTATFTPQSGQVITLRDQGTDNDKDSDADPTSGATDAFTLTSGQNDITLDAGVKPIDLSLTKEVISTAEHYSVGDTIVYLITLRNAETFSTATGVQVTDHLPAGLEFLRAYASQGTFDPVTGIWDVGVLAGGEYETLTIEATPAAPQLVEGVQGSGTLLGS
jgi:uncharacterized repeat protein (TIGR01451 family)